jgi:PPK2 family polyphosphate:nucleotide phosphotransferase
LIAPLRVAPGRAVTLPKDFDPRFTDGLLHKEDSDQSLQTTVELLSEYQDRLAAQATTGLLVVLQGLDASGKDGIVRHVMTGVNPQGLVVHSFKTPSAEELAHDFLWRAACHLPGRGQIAVFNRSHYEEVLVVRVHPELLDQEHLPPAARHGGIWKRRFREINDWERHLVENGITVVKLLLNISREEQRTRFLKRIDLAEKNWKFSPADAREREYWDAYQGAISDMLTHTSTEWAPWYVIPADHKWFARIAAGAVLANALIELDPHYPTVDPATSQALAEERRKLEAEARTAPTAGSS